jgi:hypothetical protein
VIIEVTRALPSDHVYLNVTRPTGLSHNGTSTMTYSGILLNDGVLVQGSTLSWSISATMDSIHVVINEY